MTPMLKRIFEVSATVSNSLSASSNSLLSYRPRAVTQVSISCATNQVSVVQEFVQLTQSN